MTNEHNIPALSEGTIEETIGTYGRPFLGIQMSRETAQEYAREVIGTRKYVTLYPGNTRYFRVISTRLEDDTPGDPSKGRVVAICQPLPNRQMEVK